MSVEAMRQALEALEQLQGGCTDSDDGTVEAITVWCPEVIDALRLAIEQAEKQEPVAWRYNLKHRGSFEGVSTEYSPVKLSIGENWTPLYTAPSMQNDFNPDWDQAEPLRESLREHMEEIQRLRELLNQSESRLHEVAVHCEQVERNRDTALLALRQAEQAQPVGEVMNERGEVDWISFVPPVGTPLYTAPPQRKPWVGLTGDEVNEFAAGCHLGNSVQGAIRKAEAKLKEKNT